jgi:hypothetical protein
MIRVPPPKFHGTRDILGHRDPAGVTKSVQHILAQIITHLLGVPLVGVEQPLHAVRAQITGLLRDRPGVLALGAREQPQQIHPAPAARVCLPEPARYQREHVVKPSLPTSQAIINYSP